MSWDLTIDHAKGDLVSGYVTGQDEILQRVTTRLWRHLGEWFCNTSVGMPWYEGPSDLMAGKLSRENGLLGSRTFNPTDIAIRNEIASTEGVIQVLELNTAFYAETRVYSVRARIATEYGLSEVISIDYPLTA